MSKITKLAAGLAVVPMLALSAPAFADSPGQLAGGDNVYVVKNVTQSGEYGSSATAACNEEVQFSIELHNTEFGQLTGIKVSANLPTASDSTSTMTATTDAGGTTGTTATVQVNIPAGSTLGYENGTTKLYAGTNVTTLADGITTAAGVAVGDLDGSTSEFVNFDAKVSCPTPKPPVNKITVCELDTKKIVTIKESDFNSTKYTKDLSQCATPTTPTPPTTLVNTGAGDVAGLFAAVAVAGAVAYRWFLGRRTARSDAN